MITIIIFNPAVGLGWYLKFLGIVLYVREKFQVNQSLERLYDIGQNKLNKFYYLLSFDL